MVIYVIIKKNFLQRRFAPELINLNKKLIDHRRNIFRRLRLRKGFMNCKVVLQSLHDLLSDYNDLILFILGNMVKSKGYDPLVKSARKTMVGAEYDVQPVSLLYILCRKNFFFLRQNDK